MPVRALLFVLLAFTMPTVPVAAAAAPSAAQITVRFDPALGALHGRLLVFLEHRRRPGKEPIEPDYAHPRDTEILAAEVDAPAGARITIAEDGAAYPAPLAGLRRGTYAARAELDVQHRYTYDGGQPGDPVSGNVMLRIGPGVPATIGVHARRAESPSPKAPRGVPGGRMETFVSPALSAFAGRAVTMRAYVAPPPGYYTAGRRRYAVAFVVGGYGTTAVDLPYVAGAQRRRLRAAHLGRDLIYVFLDPHVPLGHSVFADSVNTGPWGRALTTEFIPFLESRWRMTATPGSRFLTGHSSGGWSTLWLQVANPRVFGGAWSTSPDPLDFHDFTGPDIAAARPGNFYTDAAGKPYMLVRIAGKDAVTLRDYVGQESALGDYGGQFGSFDAIFSPRGADGRPQRLFDRRTGRIDTNIARAWDARYDIVRKLRREWPRTGPDLRGKLHVVVGSWDTFHLDAGVRRLRSALAALPGNGASIEIVPRRDHFNLYRGPGGGLLARFDREMTAAAARSARTATAVAPSRTPAAARR